MLDAGSVFVKLGARVERQGFDLFSRNVHKAGAEAKKVTVRLDADTDEREFRKFERALAGARAAGARGATARLSADYDDRGFRAFERDGHKVSRTAGAIGSAAHGASRGLGGVGAAAGGAGRGLASLGTASGGASRGLFSIQSRISLIRWPLLAAGAAYAATQVFALASSLGPLIGLLGAIPSGITLAVQGIGGLALSMSGVGGAIKEAFQSQDKAATGAAKSLDQNAQSQAAVESASRGLQDAERQRTYAVEDLTRAQAEARRELQDMAAAAMRADLQQREATHSLGDARRELARLQRDPNASQDDVTHAEFALEDAKLRSREARTEAGRARTDNQRAQRAGVGGNEKVVGAQRAREDAVRGVEDAERALTDATKAATQAMGEQSAQADQLASKMAHLSPAAQDFVRFIAGMRPEFDKLRAAGAEELFPRLTRGIQDASKNLPVLRGLVAGAGREFGRFVEQGGKMLGSREWGRDMAAQGRENEVVMGRLGRAGLHLADAFRHVMRSATPLTMWLSSATEKWAKNREAQAEAGRESGRMSRFFERTVSVGKQVGRIFVDVGKAILAMGRASNEAKGGGDDMLDSIERGARAWRRWSESAKGQNSLKRYFEAVHDAQAAVWRSLKRIIDRYDDLKRAGKSSMDALAVAMGEAIGRATKAAVKNIGRTAPDIAKAFVEGFLASNIWGKLLVGAWLLRRFGGPGAIRAVGARIGAMLGLGAAAGSAGAAGVGAGTAAAGGAAAGVAAGGTAAGVAQASGGLRSLLGKLKPVAKKAGLVGLGFAVLDGLGSAFGDRARGMSVLERGQSFMSSLTFGLIPAAKKTSDRVKAIMDKIRKDTSGKLTLSDSNRPNFSLIRKKDLNDFTVAERRMLSGMARLRNEAVRSGKSMGQVQREHVQSMGRVSNQWQILRSDTSLSMKRIQFISKNAFENIRSSLGVNSREGRQAVQKNFGLTADAIVSSMARGKTSTKRGMGAILQAFIDSSRGSRRTATVNFGKAKDAIEAAVNSGAVTTARGLKEINRLYGAYLANFGIKDSPSVRKGQEMLSLVTGGAVPKPPPRARGGILRRAMGGWIGSPGEAGGDNVSISARDGSSMWNRHQTPALDAALSATGFGGIRGLVGSSTAKASGGPVRAMVGRGELKLEPEGTEIADMALRAVGLGGAQGLFDSITRPHYLARGGYVQGAVPPSGAAIRALNERMFRRGFSVTSGYRSNSTTHHGRGDASDYGNSVNNMGKLWSVLFPGRAGLEELFGPAGLYKRGQRFNDADLQSGHNDHIHVAVLSAIRGALGRGRNGGGAGAVTPEWKNIRRMVVKGPDSALKSVVQGTLDRTRAVANRRGKRLAGEAGGGGGPSGSAGRAPAGRVRNWLTKALKITGHFSQANLNALFGRVMQESGGNPRAINRWDSNAKRGTPSKGLIQTIDPTFNAYKMKGHGNIWNPVDNAIAAIRYMFSRYGHIVGPSGSGYARGGIVGTYPGIPEFAHLPRGRRAKLPGTRAKGKAVPVSTWGKRVATQARRLGADGAVTRDLETIGNEYTRTERRGKIDDTEIVVNPGDAGYVRPRGAATDVPYVDEAALRDRLGDMDRLLKVRRKAVAVWDRYAKRVRDARAVLKRGAAALRRRLGQRGLSKAAKGRVRAQIRALVGQDKGLAKAQRTTIAFGRQDSWLDFEELRRERNDLGPSSRREALPPTDSADGKDDPDLQALLAQAETARDTLQETVRLQTAAFNVFSGPGDIGGGAQYALRAAAYPGLGEGRGGGLPGGPALTSGYAPPMGYPAGVTGTQGVAPGLYLARVDDVAGKDRLARLSNAGNASMGYVGASSERVGP